MTSGLVKLLHQLTGCHIIYKNKNDGYDFNYDDLGSASGYKKKIVDIHGMSEDKFLDIDLGTDYNNSLNNYKLIPETMKLFFEEQGIINVGFNQLFPASFSKTVTKTTSNETDVPSIQIEINKIYRDLDKMDNIIKLITAFENIIKFFKQPNWVDNKRELFDKKI